MLRQKLWPKRERPGQHGSGGGQRLKLSSGSWERNGCVYVFTTIVSDFRLILNDPGTTYILNPGVGDLARILQQLDRKLRKVSGETKSRKMCKLETRHLKNIFIDNNRIC